MAESASYFTDDSMIRRVHRERVLALAGQRALLMQAAHPLAVVGLLAHTGSLDEPYERLARTAQVMSTIAFGSRSDADRMTKRVRSMHRRVRGRLAEDVGPYPKGTEYRADDPELLMWILYTLVDSAIVLYGRYVAPLGHEERERLWSDYRIVGRLFGLRARQMPTDIDALEAYGASMLEGDRLYVNDWARERARAIVLEPPVGPVWWPLVQGANFITITLLPDRIREQYGFAPLPPPAVRRAVVDVHAGYARRLLVPLLPGSLRLVPAARGA